MEQALGAMTIVDQEFVFTELNEYSLAPRHNTSSMDVVWGRIKEFSVLAMVVVLVGVLAHVALSPGPMSLPGTHAMPGGIPGEEEVSPRNMTRWTTNGDGVVIENEDRLLDNQTGQNPYALPNGFEAISPSPPPPDEIQQPTVAPQTPTTTTTHEWFNESFLIAAIEADIRAAQQHAEREENDLIPRPSTNQQRIDHGRPASPEHQLAPQQRNTDVEPNRSCSAYAGTLEIERVRQNHQRRVRNVAATDE
jgi:hypothetical protein